jgi:transposase InsO family protein
VKKRYTDEQIIGFLKQADDDTGRQTAARPGPQSGGKMVCLPAFITVDHGIESTSRALDFWAWENKVQLDFTRPGKPTDNGLCESFNGRPRRMSEYSRI